jgi:hypothetical protein
LIHASLLPNQTGASNRRCRDFVRDEKIMAGIFEKFVRNFASRHLPGASGSAMHIHWRASDPGKGTLAMLPGMLLYSSNGYHLDHVFTLHGTHRIRVFTIDLNQAWMVVEKQLKELFLSATPVGS